MSITAMLLTGSYPAMPTPPKSLVTRNRSHVADDESKRHVTQHPPRVRMTAADSIARGEATRKLILAGLRELEVTGIRPLCGYLAEHGMPMSVTNCRKHLNKLIVSGQVERTEFEPGTVKIAILYWLAEDEE